MEKRETPAELKKAAKNLEKSLLENDNLKIARNYEVLAQGYIDKEDFAAAEEYLFKALDAYTTAKNTAGRTVVIRAIARVQESQNKLRAALKNYKAAELAATGKTFKSLNANDYNRLKNKGDFNAANKYLNANILLLKKGNKKREVADAYIQLAEISLKSGDSIKALDMYRQALPYAGNIPRKVIKVYSEIAKLYVHAKRFEEAVSVEEVILANAKDIKDYDTQIQHLRYTASIYFTMGDSENAENAIRESYKIATANGKTFEARESLMLLIEYYKSVGNNEAGLAMHEEFLQNLDRIILSDTSLTDAKTFKVTEERIRRLESEKGLKDELISRKNTFNYLLIGSMVLLLLFSGFIIKALYSIKIKNKEIALQSLRREMNPHFIFNSLNSVNHFIAQNNELEANKFLTSYSNLMRNTMENSNKDFITLSSEIDNLTKYLQLEHLRFKDKFDYEIIVDDKLDRETIWVPNMIIQPNLENAIWHGLRYKQEKGILKLTFIPNGKNVIIIIDDNGIGITKSSELKTDNQKAHQSRGLTNTKERITLLNQLYKTAITFSITEKQSPETGTIVEIIVPLITKP